MALDVPISLEDAIARERELYDSAVRNFNERVREFDPPAGIEHFYWYHTVDLGGLVTPGDYDYNRSIKSFGFPEDMSGLSVLDVGSATGYFSFEFASRGAKVTAVDLPSLHDWDMLYFEKESVVSRMMRSHQATTPEELYYRHLFGPFEFCRRHKGGDIKRVFSSVYELSPEILGAKTFDIVYIGDVLNHLFSPWTALQVLSRFCGSTLYIGTTLAPGKEPVMRFDKTSDRGWWLFTRSCAEQMLARLRFNTIDVVGEYSGILRRRWMPYKRFVIQATK